jgi:hypothetical protein
MTIVNGKFVGYGVNDVSDAVQPINHRLLLAYNTRSHASTYGVTDTTLFNAATAQALFDLVTFMNGDKASQLAAGTRGAVFPLRTDGIADLNVRKAIGAYTPPPAAGPTSLAISIGGAGSNMDGYPADICNAIGYGSYHQPIGYNTGQVPMLKNVNNSGVPEVVRQLGLGRSNFGGRNCTQIPWQVNAYSMGSIVWMIVLMRVLYGDLQQFKPMYMGSNSLGNPMRQEGHTYPGGIAVDGQGIVTPNAHDVPDCHWDFVSAAGMVDSQGNDLYALVGSPSELLETNALTLKDMRAVWNIVATGNPLTLAEQVAELALTPSFAKIEGAFGAAWNAAKFFIGQGISPHTTYQFVQTRADDARSAWDQALWHSQDMAQTLYLPYSKGVAA